MVTVTECRNENSQRHNQIFHIRRCAAALGDIGVNDLTVCELKGFGRQKGHTELYRGAEYAADYTPKMKLEVATDDDQVDAVIDAIIDAAKKAKIEDGKIFVTNLENVVRIRKSKSDSSTLEQIISPT